MKTLTITLPLPARALSPNSRLHWRTKAAATRLHRGRARLFTLQELDGRPAPKFSTYTLTFYFKTRRRRDDDNAAASCKAYRDGIADALGIDDHGLSMAAAPQMLIDHENPRLEITLHHTENA